MRMAFGVGAMLALLLAAAPASSSLFFDPDRVTAPWCLAHSDKSGWVECAYYTYEQCMETRLGVGGFCQPNPANPVAVARPPRSRR
jgi:hypothetical protein